MRLRSGGRALAAGICLCALIFTGTGTAAAENDPFGVFVNAQTGVRWVTMSPTEYLASPVALDMQARMERLSAGDFKAGAASEFDGTPDPRWDVLQVGDVTRFRGVTKGRTTIRLVTDDRVCSRTVSKASGESLRADRTARWRCRPSTASTVDGRDFVGPYLPLWAVSPAKDGELRVLMKEGAGVPAPDATDASLMIIVKQVGVLRSVGLAGGPSEVYAFTASATSMETEVEAFDGYSWLMTDFVLRAEAPSTSIGFGVVR